MVALEPFWTATTVDREPVMFIGDGRTPAQASLLFAPDAAVAVTSAAGDATYVEGVDYLVDREAAVIVRLQSSRMPIVSADDVAAGAGALTHERIVSLTYAHRGAAWAGFVPGRAGHRLPRFRRFLEERRTVTIALTGDSISAGYDSSGFHGMAPRQPGYGELFAAALGEAHAVPVAWHNFATAGWTAADGLWDSPRIVGAAPDLVIVAYGMNDACYAESAEYRAGIADLVERVRTDRPDAEFVLVSPMLATPACAWVDASRFEDYRAALEALAAADAALAIADVTRVWQSLLRRKSPYDLSGNGLNHPNDFGHRVYAQTLLALFS